jgi:hypothetical protein
MGDCIGDSMVYSIGDSIGDDSVINAMNYG